MLGVAASTVHAILGRDQQSRLVSPVERGDHPSASVPVAR
jgi:hypothetical protein